MEHRMRCKVCGKIWCFTDQDLKASQSSSLVSGLAAIGTIASAFGGTAVQQHMNYDVMERNQAKVVDYHQCPNCRSKDVSELSEEEWNEVQIQDRFPNTRVAVSINANATTESLLNRIKFQLEDKDWPSANAYCDAVLDAEPENAMAYVYKLMAELRVSEQADLENQTTPFDTKPNYQRALRFADEGLQQTLKSYIVHINERNEQERLKGLYDNACAAMQQSTTEENYKNAAALFAAIKGYKDADSLQAECLKKAEQARLETERKAAEEKAAAAEQAKKTKKIAMIAAPIVVVAIVAAVLISNFMKAQQEEAARLEAYNAAVALAEAGQYNEAIAAFGELGDYKDSAEQIKETTYNQAVALFEAGKYDKAISIFTELGNYKDSTEQIANIQNQQMEEQYQAAVSILEDGEYEEARDKFAELANYKDSASIAQQLTNEITSWDNAWEAYYSGDLNPLLAVIENHQYLKVSPEDEKNIKFLVPYIGEWKYLSGNNLLLSIHGESALYRSNYTECLSISTNLSYYNGIDYIQLFYADKHWWDYFEVNYAEQALEPDTEHYNIGDFYIELTEKDTLLVTLKRNDGAVDTCEYQRVN